MMKPSMFGLLFLLSIAACGQDGTAGPEGATGSAGPMGSAGAAGANGDPGSPGATGVSGSPGANGAPGSPGANGTYEVSTVDGGIVAVDGGVIVAAGPQGTKGDPGAKGDQGIQGVQGPGGVIWQAVVNGDGSTQVTHVGITITHASVGHYLIAWTGFNGAGIPYIQGVGANGVIAGMSVTTSGTGSTSIVFTNDTLFNFALIQIVQ